MIGRWGCRRSSGQRGGQARIRDSEDCSWDQACRHRGTQSRGALTVPPLQAWSTQELIIISVDRTTNRASIFCSGGAIFLFMSCYDHWSWEVPRIQPCIWSFKIAGPLCWAFYNGPLKLVDLRKLVFDRDDHHNLLIAINSSINTNIWSSSSFFFVVLGRREWPYKIVHAHLFVGCCCRRLFVSWLGRQRREHLMSMQATAGRTPHGSVGMLFHSLRKPNTMTIFSNRETRIVVSWKMWAPLDFVCIINYIFW